MRDNEFGVLIHVAGESLPQLSACLSSVRSIYPQVLITVVSDGVENPGYPAVCEQFSAAYLRGSYFKRFETGRLWWSRALSLGRAMHRPWILKLDPDARIHRRFKARPPFDLSGTKTPHGTPRNFENIQGGAQFWSARLIDEILASKILDSDVFDSPSSFCPNPNDFMKTWLPTGYFSTDYSMMYMIRKLCLSFGHWDEIGSHWQQRPVNENFRYAVTHPHTDPVPCWGIPADTPLHVITTCKGRLRHLRLTLPGWLMEENVTVTVVDYDCPEGTARWVQENHPDVKVVRVENSPVFNLATARNVGALTAPEGWQCFFDADLMMNPGWAAAARKQLRPGHYHVPDPSKWGMLGSVIVESKHARMVGGYDDLYTGWGCEDLDFYASLRHCGVRPAYWPGAFGFNLPHPDSDRTRFYVEKDKAVSDEAAKQYAAKKRAFMQQHPDRLPTLAERLQFKNS